jgi:hypothetical protein
MRIAEVVSAHLHLMAEWILMLFGYSCSLRNTQSEFNIGPYQTNITSPKHEAQVELLLIFSNMAHYSKGLYVT